MLLLAVSACILPKCCVERSPFSFCQPELQSVVSDRLAGSSLIQSSLVYHCLLATWVIFSLFMHLCNGFLKRCISVSHSIGTGRSHYGRVKGFEGCFEVVNYQLKLSRRQHDHCPAILQGKYKTWTPGPWTPSVDPGHGLGPSKYGPGPWTPLSRTPYFYKLRLHYKLSFDDLWWHVAWWLQFQ